MSRTQPLLELITWGRLHPVNWKVSQAYKFYESAAWEHACNRPH